MPSHASRPAPAEPGRQKLRGAPAAPAVARLWIVDVLLLSWLSMRNWLDKPSIRFPHKASTVSVVPARPAQALPPEGVVTDRSGRRQRGIDIACFKESRTLL